MSLALCGDAFTAISSVAHDPVAIDLPAPQKTGGKPLMDALSARATSRNFTANEPALPPQQLSNLLWAGFGINRPDGKRTAPTAHNSQNITIHVLLDTGAYTYEPAKNQLRRVIVNGQPVGDIRALGGTQDFARNAPVTLIYVCDAIFHTSAGAIPPLQTSAIHAGAIAQNVSLYCASAGLKGGVRMSIPKEKLAAALGITPNRIILAQSIGQDSPAAPKP
jgi:hypothetical protein